MLRDAGPGGAGPVPKVNKGEGKGKERGKIGREEDEEEEGVVAPWPPGSPPSSPHGVLGEPWSENGVGAWRFLSSRLFFFCLLGLVLFVPCLHPLESRVRSRDERWQPPGPAHGVGFGAGSGERPSALPWGSATRVAAEPLWLSAKLDFFFLFSLLVNPILHYTSH